MRSIHAVRSPSGRLAGCCEGVSSVEFALLSPVLISIVLMTIQFGFIFFTYSAAQQASWTVARLVAIGSTAAAAAPTSARGMLPGWAQSGSSISPPVLTNGTYTVSIRIPLANASPVNFLPAAYSGASLTTSATFAAEVN